MGVNNSLLKSIQTIVDKEVESASFDKTRQGQVLTNNNDGTYTIRLDGVLYNNIPSYPKVASIDIGSVVKISIPSNQPSQMYIITPKGGGGSGDHLEITQEDYDDLPTDKKQGDTVFFVTESEPEYLIMSDSVPIGAIQSYGGNVAPSGWLICDGRAISRAEYSELFYVIGTTYGSGDGSTTFNVPDLKGRVLVGVGESSATGHTNHTLGQKGGEETHTLTESELPYIDGNFTCHGQENGSIFYHKAGHATGDVASTYQSVGVKYGGATSITSPGFAFGGDSSHNIMQPYTVANYIIKAKQPPTENVIKGLDTQGVLIDAFYPVGTEYSTTNSTFDPNVTWGGTWTKTTVSDDEIVEQGTSDIWTYRKWKSGIAECWGKWSGTATAYAAPWSGAYGYYVTVPSPSGLFVSQPQTFYTSQISSGFTMSAADMGNDNLYSISAGINGTESLWHSIFRKGLWKTYTAPSLKYVWHRTA